MAKKILLICFDTPYPDNYGGVVDIERKFKFFKKKGYKIDVICSSFDTKRSQYFEEFVDHNNDFIDNVYIENVKVNAAKSPLFWSVKPFSVLLRKFDFDRIDFLKTNQYEMVLFEHLKTSHSIQKLKNVLQGSPKIYLRLHNDEAEYYGNLVKVEPHFFKKIFFWTESLKYKIYQSKVLKQKLYDGFLYISETDQKRLAPNETQHFHLPIYQEEIQAQHYQSVKEFDFLYVGNLDLNDNFDALKEIVSFLKSNNLDHSKVAIVGRCSSFERQEKVQNLFKDLANVKFSFNVRQSVLNDFYIKSKFFLNFSSNSGGVKTKLIDALNHLIPII